jgi:hypothetical protein
MQTQLAQRVFAGEFFPLPLALLNLKPSALFTVAPQTSLEVTTLLSGSSVWENASQLVSLT